MAQTARATSTAMPAAQPSTAVRIARLATFGAAVLAALISTVYILEGPWPFDAIAYWTAWSHNLYGHSGLLEGYLYSPAFAQIIYPLTTLPFDWFRIVWAAISFSVYAWLLAPLGPRLSIPLLIACAPAVANGNTEFVLALVAVVGFGRPASWTAVILTKVTPSVGLVWFAVRGEWRPIAVALATTAAITVASLVVAPHLWFDWISILISNATGRPEGFSKLVQVPLTVRLPLGIGIAAVGGLTGRKWLMPIAMLFATPDLLVTSYAILAGLPRLWGHAEASVLPARQPRVHSSPPA